MSATFTLYIVDEKKLPHSLGGASHQEDYGGLVAAVKTSGARWAVLQLRAGTFLDALEAIDAKMGATGFLSALSLHNSHHNVLDSVESSRFGFFTPEQTRELHTRLRAMPAEVRETLADTEPAIAKVLHAYESTAAEAARRGYAVAVVHS